MRIRRVILSYLIKKSGPDASLKPGKYPIRPVSKDDGHRGFWKLLDEHRVEVSANEQRALDEYRTYGSSEINSYLRNNADRKNLEKGHSVVPHIDSAIGKSTLKRPVVLWRGLGPNIKEPFTKKLIALGVVGESSAGKLNWKRQPTKADMDNLVGFTFREPGFSSTTLAPNIYTSRRYVFRILLDRGQQGLFMNSAALFNQNNQSFHEGTESHYATEHEVLLPRDTVYQVESARFEKTTLQFFITLRVID